MSLKTWKELPAAAVITEPGSARKFKTGVDRRQLHTMFILLGILS
jgi:hypothetical protein